MHVNILQSLHNLTFEGVGALDLPVGGGLTLTTRKAIVAEAGEGKIRPDCVRMPTGTGVQHHAHLYAFDVRLPRQAIDATAQDRMMNFGALSQLFLQALWLVKDNGGSSGALYGAVIGPVTKQQHLPHSAIHSDARSTSTPRTFGIHELQRGIDYFKQIRQLMPSEVDSVPGVRPIALQHHTRIGRALYFLQAARTVGDAGFKAAMYCAAFECLVATSEERPTAAVSQRGARLSSAEVVARRKARKVLEALYKYRSRVVHGDVLDAKLELHLRETVVESDTLLRSAFRRILADPALVALFSTNDKAALDAHFDDKFSTPAVRCPKCGK